MEDVGRRRGAGAGAIVREMELRFIQTFNNLSNPFTSYWTNYII